MRSYVLMGLQETIQVLQIYVPNNLRKTLCEFLKKNIIYFKTYIIKRPKTFFRRWIALDLEHTRPNSSSDDTKMIQSHSLSGIAVSLGVCFDIS